MDRVVFRSSCVRGFVWGSVAGATVVALVSSELRSRRWLRSTSVATVPDSASADSCIASSSAEEVDHVGPTEPGSNPEGSGTEQGRADDNAASAPKPNYVLPPIVTADLMLMIWGTMMAVNAAHKATAFGVLLLAGSVALFTPDLALALGSETEARYERAWQAFIDKRRRALAWMDRWWPLGARVAAGAFALSGSALLLTLVAALFLNFLAPESVRSVFSWLIVGSFGVLLVLSLTYLLRLAFGGKRGAPYVTISSVEALTKINGDGRRLPVASVLFIAGTILSFIGAYYR